MPTDLEAFRRAAANGNVAPVWKTLTADLETPVSAYLKLAEGGAPDTPQITKQDIRTVEITSQGAYMLDRRPMDINTLEKWLVYYNKVNPNTVVYIRADENGINKYLYAVIDRCQRNGISRFSLRTEPSRSR